MTERTTVYEKSSNLFMIAACSWKEQKTDA